MISAENESRAAACDSLRDRFDRWLARVDQVSFVAIVLAMGLMALLVSSQVFMRYVLSSSIDSAAELSRLFFVWSIFLAIPHGIRSGIHVGIDALVIRLPRKLRHHIWRLTTGLGLVMMGFLTWLAADAVADKWQELMPTVDVTASVYYIAVLICAGHSMLHLLSLLWHDSPALDDDAEETVA